MPFRAHRPHAAPSTPVGSTSRDRANSTRPRERTYTRTWGPRDLPAFYYPHTIRNVLSFASTFAAAVTWLETAPRRGAMTSAWRDDSGPGGADLALPIDVDGLRTCGVRAARPPPPRTSASRRTRPYRAVGPRRSIVRRWRRAGLVRQIANRVTELALDRHADRDPRADATSPPARGLPPRPHSGCGGPADGSAIPARVLDSRPAGTRGCAASRVRGRSARGSRDLTKFPENAGRCTGSRRVWRQGDPSSRGPRAL